jgi:ERCC4-type nuclease
MRRAINTALHQTFLIADRVHVRQTNTTEETANFLSGMTRMLAEAPHREPLTSLSVVGKSVTGAGKSGGTGLTGAWIGALNQIPGMSLEKARRVVDAFPTLRSLDSTYRRLENEESVGGGDDDEGVDACKELLEYKMGKGRREKVLSERVWHVIRGHTSDEVA